MSRVGAGGSARFLGFAEIAARFVVPAAAGLVLASMVVGRGWAISLELHLIAPRQARAGEVLPMRAHVYGDLRRPEGPRLLQQPVLVELVDGGERVLAETTLRPGFGDSMEGSLALPADVAAGELRLRARVDGERGQAQVDSTLRVVGGTPQPAAGAVPRALPPLRQLSLGPVQAVAGATPPSSLAVRVGGGACVPEQPCQLFVHLGEPAANVTLERSPSVSHLPDSPSSPGPTTGVSILRVATHGPEAQVVMVAHRDGAAVARRALRLPVDLSASAPVLAGSRLDRRQLRTGLATGQGGCIADLFDRRRWLRTASFARCDALTLPTAGLPAGPLRVQLRRDVFGSRSAGVRAFYPRTGSGSDDELLARLAQEVLEAEPDDPFARALAAGGAPARPHPEAAAGYLLAALEQGIRPLPPPVSSLPAALEGLQARRERISRGGVWLLSLCGLVLTLLLVLRGLRAGAEAGRIMGDAGEEAPAIERQQLRIILRVAAVGLSMLLAFGAIAMYVIARASGP